MNWIYPNLANLPQKVFHNSKNFFFFLKMYNERGSLFAVCTFCHNWPARKAIDAFQIALSLDWQILVKGFFEEVKIKSLSSGDYHNLPFPHFLLSGGNRF